MDFDQMIGFWIRDVPYIWVRGKTWDKCGRFYICPDGWVNKPVFKDLKGVCQRFFMFCDEKMYEKGSLRINGIRYDGALKPLVLQKGFSKIYDQVGSRLTIKQAREIFSSKKKVLQNIQQRPSMTPIKLPPVYPATPGQILTLFPSRKLADIAFMLYFVKRFGRKVFPIVLYEDMNLESKKFEDTIAWFFNYTYYHKHQKHRFEMKDIFRKLMQNKERFAITIYSHQYQEDAHANLLIIDKKEKTIELVDPHGYGFHPDFNLEKTKENLELPSFKVHQTSDVSPPFSFQIYEELLRKDGEKIDYDGYCYFWSFWMAELRLMNPEISSKRLYKLAMNTLIKHKVDFLDMIRRYVKNMKPLYNDLKERYEKEGNKGIYNFILDTLKNLAKH